MGEYLILEFQTRGNAESVLQSVNELAGLPDGGVQTWDIVHESPVGTFYFADPRLDERFSSSVALLNGVASKQFPQEWTPKDA
jgi:hypothetical protein